MKPELLPGVAKDELNLVLSFFSRVDAKASVVLGVDTAMAGYLAGHMPSLKALPYWQTLIPLTAFPLIGNSIWQLYTSEPSRNSSTSLWHKTRPHTSKTCSVKRGETPKSLSRNSII